MIPLFVQFDPLWNGTHLEVDDHTQHDPDSMSTLSSMVLYCFRWVPWTKSRWCTAGRAGRFLLRSWAMGIYGAVDECFNDPDSSDYLLAGFKRCSLEVRQMLGIVSFSAQCAEPGLLELLSDDRFLRKAGKMYKDMETRVSPSVISTGMCFVMYSWNL